MTEQNLHHPEYEYMGYRRQDIFPITQLAEGKRKKTKGKKRKYAKRSKKRKTRTIKKI